ncbi:hypothetical protein N0V90_004938 [Kalmusia sp. IMI 367209]|nr:hypothetical protein N0V90_004938 [Kalmusia sp. IMI 367209]
MAPLPVPAVEQDIQHAPLIVHLYQHDEKVEGDLVIDRVGGSEVHFEWQWNDPATHRPATVTWSENDEGKATRYGCRHDTEWSKDRMQCNGDIPEDERELDRVLRDDEAAHTYGTVETCMASLNGCSDHLIRSFSRHDRIARGSALIGLPDPYNVPDLEDE